MGFEGFPDETFRLLEQLMLHNNRTWFADRVVTTRLTTSRRPLAFIEALEPKLAELPGGAHYEPRINGSLFRINRDIRFSSDKAQYKNHNRYVVLAGQRKGWIPAATSCGCSRLR